MTEMDMSYRFIREAGVAADVATLAEPVIEDLGFRVVRIQIGGGDNTTLQIMAEQSDGTLSIENCSEIARAVSPVLDVHDPVAGKYFLEVSSTGIDRPLARGQDFVDWIGYEAKIKVKEMIGGQKRFRGILAGVENDEILLKVKLDGETEEAVLGFHYSLIEQAKLVLNDDMLKISKKKR